jgi:hypothetical protein
MRDTLLYPYELIWGHMWHGEDLKVLNQIMSHEVLLDVIVDDESGQFMFNLTIMCENGLLD